MNLFAQAKRPLLILGAGIHIAQAEAQALAFARAMGVPVVCTWGAVDLFHHDDPLYFGGFGTHGVRYANFAVQNADVILTIGTRLDTKATGSPAKDFAPNAPVYMVDIDPAEIAKFSRMGRPVEGICCDLRVYMSAPEQSQQPERWAPWFERLRAWKAKYPPGLELNKGVNPYTFIEQLSEELAPDDVIVSDTGCVIGWMAQAFKFKGQTFIHAWNNTPMGYGLPAAVGAAFATGKRIILVTGDGGLAVNITEFATIARHKLPIKTFLFNNRGHAMCRQTQRTWLGGVYPSTSHEGGLATPNYEAIARAYDIDVFDTSEDIYDDRMRRMLAAPGPTFLQQNIDPDYQLWPQVTFGRKLEDAEPLLDRVELAEIMNNG